MNSNLKNLTDLLSDDLKEVNDLILHSIQPLHEPQITKIAKYLLQSGGKRLRPLLTLAFARALGYEGDQHFKLAASVELLHTATLLHDDVIDHSEQRRGSLTVNKKWGNKRAILLGDHLFSHAFLHMVHTNNLACLNAIANATKIITEGEVLQLSLINNPDISEEVCYEVINSKTAELFAVACEVGGLIAVENEETQKAIRNFGFHFGVGFQIRDDILDIIGNKQTIGKNPGDDLAEGKITLVSKIALETLPKDQASILRNIILNPIDNKNSIPKIIPVIAKSETITEVQKLSDLHFEKATNYLDILPDSEIKKYLIGICTELNSLQN